ncbi:TatD family hydrolase [Cellulomonas sp. RIT-PI-Y]|uniref:TatD family hydrolase n=1 Tax=Cellulomonas sp. RIT-PI-Y TaxID=3035297 RepID=UPI0021D99360|nr:TatD family hydrolase [Cellulomonas sp. RIT-PI-Y]
MARKRREPGWPASPEPLPSPVPDNHTHLESVLGVREEPGPASLDEHLDLAASVGVARMVQVGCDLDAIAWTDAVLRADAGADVVPPVPMRAGRRALLGAVAIHPNEAVLHAGVHEVAPDGLDPDPGPAHELSLDDALATVERTARDNDRVRAIGETGLDYFRAGPRGRAVQREAFRAHIALAKELGLAMQIHDRDAHDDVVDLLRRDGAPERTVFHCFSGGPALAEVCAAEGWFASFAGPVTFGANDDLRAALRVLPLDRVLVETDAPYLTPHPLRGRPNSPYLVPLTVRRIADELGQDLDTLCRTLARTTERVYGTW